MTAPSPPESAVGAVAGAGCRLPAQCLDDDVPGCAEPGHAAPGYTVRDDQESVPERHDGYVGSARLTVGSARFDVQVELRGYFEPIDGRYHWYGRIATHDGVTTALAPALAGGRAAGVLETLAGFSPCEVSEPDLWDRYRVTGQSTPPYQVAGQDLSSGEQPVECSFTAHFTESK